ncbi:MAG TPA: ATP-grasp domain-containing protein [Sedimentisphaerales bacterium]|nr:ATP-grasp domain-containing protein [Sedimentisphaerales bacterium]
MSNKRVLVVGTTADYIDIINRRFPEKAIFVTDFKQRSNTAEVPPDAKDELLCDLSKHEQVLAALKAHLNQWQIELTGIACFDCESMLVSSFIAHSFGLCYPSADAIMACRSKYTCKKLWQRANLSCPAVELVNNASDAVNFMQKINGDVVLKPLTGSGSELVFSCSTKDQCVAAFNTLQSKLANHPDSRMYELFTCDGKLVDPRKVFVIEELIQGDEYSCDFTIDGDKVEIIRIALKIIDTKQAFGTTLAYILPGLLPQGLDKDTLGNQLRTAAKSLGLDRTVCMVDFIVRNNHAHMIELAPRPGGDCLPPLLLNSCGIDILERTLEFAQGHPFLPDRALQWRLLVGVRLFATCGGEITKIDTSTLLKDGRVVECYLKREPGHQVVLPPEDYDSRIIGHVIFTPTSYESIKSESIEIASKLKIEMKRPVCATVNQS